MPGPPGEKVGVGRMQQIPEVVVQPAQDRHRYESAHHRNETADLLPRVLVSIPTRKTPRSEP